MPSSHRLHASWTPERLIQWAREAGPATASVAEKIIAGKPHPEIGFKAVLGLINLSKKFGRLRLDKASQRALDINSPTYKSVKSILYAGLDQVALGERPKSVAVPVHGNIRGPEYYLQTLTEEK